MGRIAAQRDQSFSQKGRKDYLDQLPAKEERRMMRRLYAQHDHAIAQWKETLQEVDRVGAEFWEVREFQGIPGVGPMAAHVFSAIIEEPARFANKHKLWKYSQLGITDRTSDHKPLGYQRLDRRGNRELKNLSYHAWRTACKSTTGPNVIKAFYHQSRLRTGSVRHARLNTQRKILETMWILWLRRQPFEPKRFAQIAPSGTRLGESDVRLAVTGKEKRTQPLQVEDLPGRLPTNALGEEDTPVSREWWPRVQKQSCSLPHPDHGLF
jgi:hypothetical protein